MKVLNFGALNIDYVYEVDHMMMKGETQLANSRNIYAGGKGLNQAVALGRAGVKTWHAGNIGTDGAFMLDMLAKSGVDTSLVQRHENVSSGHTIIQNDKEGDNCILVFGGANQCVTKEQVEETLKHFEEGDMIVLQNEVNQLGYIIEQAHAKKMKVVLNPSPMDEKIEGYRLDYVDYLFLNEIEAKQLTGLETDEAEELIAALRRTFPCQKVLLTKGTEGSWYMDEERVLHQEAFKVKALDTTAAGDTFTGYFIAGLVHKDSIEASLQRAAKASSITVSRKGAAPSIPFAGEIEE